MKETSINVAVDVRKCKEKIYLWNKWYRGMLNVQINRTFDILRNYLTLTDTSCAGVQLAIVKLKFVRPPQETEPYHFHCPFGGGGLRALMRLRAMPVVAQLLVGPPLPNRSQPRSQTKCVPQPPIYLPNFPMYPYLTFSSSFEWWIGIRRSA